MSDEPSKIVPMGPSTEALGRNLGKGSGQRRMDALFSRTNARALVRALPIEDLYFLIKDVGLSDAGLLVSMATSEQFQGFIDLEAWNPAPEGAQLQTDRVLEWLEVVREADPDAYRGKLQSLDLEIIELILRGGMLIVDRREEEEAPRPPPRPGPESLTWELTDCGNYYIAYTDPDSTEGKALRRMFREIYAIDAFGASRLLAAVRVELDSEISESALRVRTGRMEDLGFPPLEIALELYARRDPGAELPLQPAAPENIPGFQLSKVPEGSFLQRAASRIVGVGPRTQLDRGLLYLTNMALVADRVSPHDEEEVAEVTERVNATLSLSLEHLSRGDELVASELLGSRALKSLFQVGFTLTLDLQQRARTVLREAGLEEALAPALFDEPERSALQGLLHKRPVLARSLLVASERGWPGDPGAYLEEGEAPLGELPEGRRAFEHRSDLLLAEQALEGILAAARLMGPEGSLHHSEEEAPPLSARIDTLLVQRALGGTQALEPLSPEAASEGLALLFEPGGALRPQPFRTLAEALAAEQPGGLHLVARAFARLGAEARPVYRAGERPDPRYLSVLWLTE